MQPTRDQLSPWGKATSAPRNQKTPEQIAEEEAEKREREEAAKAERSARVTHLKVVSQIAFFYATLLFDVKMGIQIEIFV